jgi:hypothetical protein
MLLANNSPDVSVHVEDLIDILLWRITEADGKYNTRHKTTGALACTDKSQLRHEHVYQRSKMITTLVRAEPGEVDTILKDAIGCTVTEDEHALLLEFDGLYGWERYRQAGIVVMNTETGERVV